MQRPSQRLRWILVAVVLVPLCSCSFGKLADWSATNHGGKKSDNAQASVTSLVSDSDTAGGGGKVRHASESDFQQVVLEADSPVLVDFYAEWCPPCKKVAPILDELAAENPDVKIVKVDIDKNSRLAKRYSVNSIPSLKVFQDGQVIEESSGAASKEQLEALLRR